ncbi:MAG: tetratricopeptide repeat protein [Hyphomicrobiales bacterium]|nr:tetratricopeptide repeat protein [Hyphomicrobiales bacterium]
MSGDSSLSEARQKPRLRGILAAAVVALSAGGCVDDLATSWQPEITRTVQQADSLKYFPSDTPYKLGVEHFNRGNFGIAEQYFRDAVEKAPKDAAVWIGLAASYDRILRFDLADRAYGRAITLKGETVQILNNQGYSYMLRGDLDSARRKFLKAAAIEPDNPMIRNNILLLDGSQRYIERDTAG